MLGPQAHRLGLILMHVKERDRDRKQERLRETEQEGRERMELFSIIQPAPFWVQRSTSEKWACSLELSLRGLAGHRGQTRSGRTARGRGPLHVRAPQHKERSEQVLSFSSSSIPPHQAPTESFPARPAAGPRAPLELPPACLSTWS